jgi:hypothetical protein
MRSFFLDIIVIELCSMLEVSPSNKKVNISLSNQISLSGVIMVLFWHYCGVVMVISLVICLF